MLDYLGGDMSLFSAIVIILDILALFNIIKSKARTIVNKAVWSALIIIMPCIGFGLWYCFGRIQEPINANNAGV